MSLPCVKLGVLKLSLLAYYACVIRRYKNGGQSVLNTWWFSFY